MEWVKKKKKRHAYMRVECRVDPDQEFREDDEKLEPQLRAPLLAEDVLEDGQDALGKISDHAAGFEQQGLPKKIVANLWMIQHSWEIAVTFKFNI